MASSLKTFIANGINGLNPSNGWTKGHVVMENLKWNQLQGKLYTSPAPSLSLCCVGKDKVNANKQEEQRAKAEEGLEKLHQLITQRGQWKANCEYNCSSKESIVGGEEGGAEGTADKRWVHESVIKCARAGTTTGSGDADDNAADTCC